MKDNSSGNKALTIKKITTPDELFTLLAKFSDHNKNFFMTQPWLDSWYLQYWQKNDQLCSLAIFDQNKLIALAPFYIKVEDHFPFLKTLYLLGQGEPEHASVASEYVDIFIEKSYQHATLSLLIAHINTLNIDLISIRAVLANDHIVSLIKQIPGQLQTRNFSRYFVQTEQWHSQKLSKNTRARLKRSSNQFQKLNTQVKWLANEELQSLWPMLHNFHQMRWHKKGADGAFLSDDFNSFHITFIKNHPSSVAACGIFIDNQVIAINYYLADHDCYYFYQSGWDEVNYAKLSPGLFLHAWAIEHCPVKYYDFMMGGLKNSYKSKFAGTTEPMQSLLLIKSPKKYFIKRLINKIKKTIS